jgi:uncharacterized membrane protein (DUF4010 family)
MPDLYAVAVALGLGLLVGFQREWADSQVAGIRTFPLITILGSLTGLIGRETGGWPVAVGLAAVASVVILGNVAKFKRGEFDPGITTEIAALVMYGVGAALVLGYVAPAIAIGGVVAVLLHWKASLHRFVDRIGEGDLRAFVRFVLIALVILPLLPNRAYDVYGVVNPFEIWLMVVLIVGISLAAWIVYRLMGARVGTVLAGVLGGFISSTATTVSSARRGRDDPGAAPAAALVIMLASTVAFVRVLVEIAAVAGELFGSIAPPLAAMMIYMLVVSLGTLARVRNELRPPAESEAPSNLGAAILFGALYAAVLFAAAVAKEHFGEEGLYIVAGLSGLTDMDAITLSSAKLVEAGHIDAGTGWRVILLGALANLAFKGGAVAVLGSGRLKRHVLFLFGLTLAGGVVILALWP